MSVRPITQTLALLHGGAFIDSASEKLAELVKRVEETGKSGTMTMKLSLKNVGGAMQIAADIKASIPEPKPDTTLLWPTVEGNLVMDNPAQQKLDLRDASAPRAPLRAPDTPITALAVAASAAGIPLSPSTAAAVAAA